MRGFWTADSAVENIIYILLGLAWVVIQLVARNTKKKMGEPPAKPAGREPLVPPPSVLNPEEELRRFLQELSGEVGPPPPPPPPPPSPSPASSVPASAAPTAFAPPPSQPAAVPRATGARVETVRPARPRPKARPVPVPPSPQPRAIGIPDLSEPISALSPPDYVRKRSAQPSLPRSSFLFSIPLASPRSIGAFSEASGPRYRRRRVAELRLRDRRALRNAVLYRVILDPPQAFHL